MKVVSSFIKGPADTGSGVNVSETMHGRIPLLDSPMILLQAIVEVCVRPMLHVFAQGFTPRSWIGGMAMRYHSFRRMANNGESLLEKPLSGPHVPFLT
ncbi:hypothetical protein KSB_59820 [Ktedonobacter robiniae]|uniref:Uncharacterized protein n=1 Tax=Ktedonobacter robiniae TaxID=2778365 RepID=A0ABQ3UYS6_9CHLR|nr:hypothetical protein KSB_59820 [Ktedonobacter robiniae]